MRVTLALPIAILTMACGGGAPSSPSRPQSAQPWTLTGSVVATVTGIPLAGVTLLTGTQTLTTDAAGTFTLSGSGTASVPVVLSGDGIVNARPRGTRFPGATPTPAPVSITGGRRRPIVVID
jgi:hypothetical protein